MKNTLSILTVPAFDDNYLWIVHDGHHAAVIDPGDAAPILAVLAQQQLRLSAILLTHHHADHVGGVETLLQYAAVPVFGPRRQSVGSISRAVQQDEQIQVPGLDLVLKVIEVPGHTLGHVAYFAAKQQWLFCGDTLFAGGCGRLFEGTPAQMLHSLDKLASLPDATAVYCAHEYTLSNLRFALAVEPGNLALQARIASEQNKRTQGLATVPSQLGLEKQTNPFLRIREPAVIAGLLAAGKIPAAQDEVGRFAALREWKNQFR